MLAAALTLALSAGSGARGPLSAGARRVPSLGRVAIVVMENKRADDVLGSPEAPYLNALARRFAVALDFYGTTHPSLPNYLALTGGSTFGVTANCTTCSVSATSLVDQLERAGISWKAYMEGMPEPCFRAAGAGRYAKKHNPFAYYERIVRDPRRCAKIVPLGRLSTDLRRGRLPRFAWITPGLCHDTHDCGVGDGDRFLARLLPPLLAALGPRGLLIVTWDEGSGEAGCCRKAAGGRIATIAAGGLARRHARSHVPLDHYSILRTIEDGFGLPRLRAAGCTCTRPLTSLLRSTS